MRSKRIYAFFVTAGTTFAAFADFLTTTVFCLAHFSDLGSLFNTEAFFLHFEEQYQKVAASFLMYITPVPSGIGLPQNEHLLGLYDISTNQPSFALTHYFIFLASRSVSRSIKTSPILTGPFTFRVRILPLSRPSRSFTLTCVISPATPVLPTTWMISAGVTRSSALVLKKIHFLGSYRKSLRTGSGLQFRNFGDYLIDKRLRITWLYDTGRSRPHIDT